jgi:putative endonuclease
MRCVVYILKSQTTGKYYVGHSENLEERVRRHNDGESLSTRKGIPWVVIRAEEYATRGEAMTQEKRIKKRGIGRYLEQTGASVGT